MIRSRLTSASFGISPESLVEGFSPTLGGLIRRVSLFRGLRPMISASRCTFCSRYKAPRGWHAVSHLLGVEGSCGLGSPSHRGTSGTTGTRLPTEIVTIAVPLTLVSQIRRTATVTASLTYRRPGAISARLPTPGRWNGRQCQGQPRTEEPRSAKE